MDSATRIALYWLSDIYLLASVLLSAACLCLWLLRQPIRRLTVAWAAVTGLAALVLLSLIPGWRHLQVAGFEHAELHPEPMHANLEHTVGNGRPGHSGDFQPEMSPRPNVLQNAPEAAAPVPPVSAEKPVVSSYEVPSTRKQTMKWAPLAAVVPFAVNGRIGGRLACAWRLLRGEDSEASGRGTHFPAGDSGKDSRECPPTASVAGKRSAHPPGGAGNVAASDPAPTAFH